MWTIAEYQPTSFFSLRPFTATSSGGKSLIAPTPFAIKMALLDAAIRTQGLEQGRTLFPTLRNLQIAIRLPRWIIVNKTFVRIWRINDSVSKKKKAQKALLIAEARANRKWPYYYNIAFREYIQFGGSLALGFEGMPSSQLIPLLLQINYLGKRGGFIQLIRPPETATSLSNKFTLLTESVNGEFPLGVLQMLDDCGPTLTFEKANVYSRKTIKVGRDRIFHQVILPYRLTKASRGFTLYQRLEPGY